MIPFSAPPELFSAHARSDTTGGSATYTDGQDFLVPTELADTLDSYDPVTS